MATTTGELSEEGRPPPSQNDDGIPSDDLFTTRAVLGWCAERWPPEEGAVPSLSFSDFLEMWVALSMQPNFFSRAYIGARQLQFKAETTAGDYKSI